MRTCIWTKWHAHAQPKEKSSQHLENLLRTSRLNTKILYDTIQYVQFQKFKLHFWPLALLEIPLTHFALESGSTREWALAILNKFKTHDAWKTYHDPKTEGLERNDSEQERKIKHGRDIYKEWRNNLQPITSQTCRTSAQLWFGQLLHTHRSLRHGTWERMKDDERKKDIARHFARHWKRTIYTSRGASSIGSKSRSCRTWTGNKKIQINT